MATDDAPFVWGSGGERLSQDAIKRRRAIAEAMIKSGGDYSPIAHPLQGVNRVAQALIGAYQSRQADAAEAASGRIAGANMAEMLKAYGASPDTPAPGSSPIAYDGSAAAPGSVPSSGPSIAVTPRAGGGAPSAGGGVPVARFSGTQGEYLNSMLPAAMEASAQTGIDPRMIVAQAAIETGYGRSAPGNNHFGIKARASEAGQTLGTSEVVNGQTVRQNAKFRTFDSPEASVAGYADFVNRNPRYAGYKGAEGLDAQAAALQASGYATDPNYGRKVLAIARSLPTPANVGPGVIDRPSVPNAGGGVPLAYRGQPALVDAPATPPVIAGASAPLSAEMTPPAPQVALGSPPAAVQPAAPRIAAALASTPSAPVQPRMRLSQDRPLYSPAEIAALDDGAGAADLPSQGAQRLADMPAQGSRPAGFYVPPAKEGGEPTIVPSPDDPAPGAAAAQAAPSTRSPAGLPPASVRVAQALNPTAIRTLTDSTATDAERQIAMLLLSKQMKANEPETYTFHNVGGRFIRTGNRGSVTETGIGDTDKPTFGVIAEDEYGKKQYGWIDQRGKTATPYNPPAGSVGGGPSTIPPVPPGVDPKAWRDAHSKAAAEGSATGNFDQEAKLRGEYTKNLGTFADVHDAFGRVIASTQGREDDPKAKSPAADISLVFGFMKMLDPGSVVREGEYATAKNATGVPDRIVNTYNKLLNGEFLSADQRQDFVNQAGKVYGQARRKAEETAGTYRNLSKGYGINADRVVALPEALQVPSLVPKAAPPPAPAPPPPAAVTRPPARVVGPAGGDVARPATEADFNALPSGSYYVDPDDGRTYRKP